MSRFAGIIIAAVAAFALFFAGCATQTDGQANKAMPHGKTLAKSGPARGAADKSKAAKSPRTGGTAAPDAAETPLADAPEPKQPATPEVKQPEPATGRAAPAADEEPATLAERRSQIQECELIPIPSKRDFWLSSYYRTGELLEPEDVRTPLQKREPNQAVVGIIMENGVPAYYFNGARVASPDVLKEKLGAFRMDVIRERQGNRYLQPEVIIDAERNVPREFIETVYDACLMKYIEKMQTVVRQPRTVGGD